MKTQLKMIAVAMTMTATMTAQAAFAAVSLPPVKPAEATGNIVVAGSSTVYPLTQKIAELFRADGYTGNITVDNIGSGAGISRFCRGEIDVANSSRAMTAAEITTCKGIGREPVQFRVGTDGLTIVVSSKNKFVSKLTRKQIGLIFSGKAKKWSDVDAKYPAQDIKVFSPGTDSGTYDYFAEEVYKEERDAKARRAIVAATQGIQLSEDDNVLVQGVEGSEFAIGYFGYAYYIENKSKLKAVAYEGVLPSDATVPTGKYKFSRPLFIISTGKIMKDKPQVASFINYYLTNVGKVIKGVGYFAESDKSLDEAKNAWLGAVK